jgi:hypothetical protein
VFSGRIGFYPLDKLKAVKVSDESDFRIAEAIVGHLRGELPAAQYWDGFAPRR